MNLGTLVLRNVARTPLRTGLTAAGVAVAVLVFSALASLDRGVRRMVEETGGEQVLTVFERFKACPPYSRLPIHYQDRIAGLPHVAEVMPVRFVLSNCQTTTDLVAVHGVDPEKLPRFRSLEVDPEALRTFQAERGAALVGRVVAERYGWRAGDQVTLKELGGISFIVRGVFRAPGSSIEGVVLVDREYLEYSLQQVGQVTMFLVRLDDPRHADSVAEAIDAVFAGSAPRTRSSLERAFIARSIEDFQALVDFALVIAWTSLGLVLLAVANSISMSVRERLREMAVLKTLGFRRRTLCLLIVGEAAFVALVAAGLGLAIVAVAVKKGGISVGVEGYAIHPDLGLRIVLSALGLGAGLAALGAWLPAWSGAGQPIVTALREVDA